MSGMTAVTHTNRDAQPDAGALLNHLRANGSRVGLWAISGHGPLAIAVSDPAACLVLINPITADALPSVPTFIVRAGKDETPGLNAALDPLLARALGENRPISFVNYPEAPHAFDLYLDSPETRRILRQALDFLGAHLR
jgi:acetyl esterase/lipase